MNFSNLTLYWICKIHSSCLFLTFILASITSRKIAKNKITFLVWVIVGTYWSNIFSDCGSSILLGSHLFKICFTSHQNCNYWGQCLPNFHQWLVFWLLHNLVIACDNFLGFFKNLTWKIGYLFLMKWANF